MRRKGILPNSIVRPNQLNPITHKKHHSPRPSELYTWYRNGTSLKKTGYTRNIPSILSKYMKKPTTTIILNGGKVQGISTKTQNKTRMSGFANVTQYSSGKEEPFLIFSSLSYGLYMLVYS